MAKPGAKRGQWPAALEWFRNRVAMTPQAAAELERRAEMRAFTVAGVTQMRVVDHVLKALKNAVADGEALDAFKKRVRTELLPQWKGTVANPSARMETIFRTNIQSAYALGRYREMTEADTLAAFPFWRFSALLDMRTTEVCRRCDGTVGPANSGWFKTHMPPLHFNCRSAVRPVAPDEAHVTRMPQEMPADGFGKVADLADGGPDIDNVEPELRVEWEAKERNALVRSPRKRR